MARLPYVDIGVRHHRLWAGGEEQVAIVIQTVPPVEVLSRLMEVANPLLVWTQVLQWPTRLGLLAFLKAPSTLQNL